MTTTDILQAISGNLTQKISINRIGRAMTDLGFIRVRSTKERGYVVVPYTADEIKSRQRLKAYDAKPESDENDTYDTNDTFF